jgi:hypothetical protein
MRLLLPGCPLSRQFEFVTLRVPPESSPLPGRQASQLHLQNGVCLRFRKTVDFHQLYFAVGASAEWRIRAIIRIQVVEGN